jgi:pimeloyl-ACP methyl ester carboxylesterase
MSGRAPETHTGYGASFVVFVLVIITMELAGCASPTENILHQASGYGFEQSVIAGAPFQHIIFSNNPRTSETELHVYIEGDGQPWIHRNLVAADPTSSRALMLRLMALDAYPAIYLGRPCYLGLHNSPPCSPLVWTHQRYSPAVVKSMITALNRYLQTRQYTRISLFGHSGGGTLARLMAEQLPRTHGVITIAANLDVAAWARYHHYSTLDGSLDPARRAPLPASVIEVHLVGERDKNVPPRLLNEYRISHPNARIQILDDFDHRCCWQAIWPEIVQQLHDG